MKADTAALQRMGINTPQTITLVQEIAKLRKQIRDGRRHNRRIDPKPIQGSSYFNTKRK